MSWGQAYHDLVTGQQVQSRLTARPLLLTFRRERTENAVLSLFEHHDGRVWQARITWEDPPRAATLMLTTDRVPPIEIRADCNAIAQAAAQRFANLTVSEYDYLTLGSPRHACQRIPVTYRVNDMQFERQAVMRGTQLHLIPTPEEIRSFLVDRVINLVQHGRGLSLVHAGEPYEATPETRNLYRPRFLPPVQPDAAAALADSTQPVLLDTEGPRPRTGMTSEQLERWADEVSRQIGERRRQPHHAAADVLFPVDSVSPAVRRSDVQATPDQRLLPPARSTDNRDPPDEAARQARLAERNRTFARYYGMGPAALSRMQSNQPSVQNIPRTQVPVDYASIETRLAEHALAEDGMTIVPGSRPSPLAEVVGGIDLPDGSIVVPDTERRTDQELVRRVFGQPAGARQMTRAERRQQERAMELAEQRRRRRTDNQAARKDSGCDVRERELRVIDLG